MPPGELDRLQRRFWRFITAPEGVERALGDVGRTDPEAVPLERWIGAPGEAEAVERLDVYANMYFYRLLEVLRLDFPKLVALVGDRPFHNLVTDYLLAHPSDNPSVRHVGRRLPAFVGGHRLAERWPYLGDLARLEWARGEVFDAPDRAPIERAALESAPPERWADLRLTLVPAMRVLVLGFPVHELWLALEEGRAPAPLPAATSLLVWRRGFLAYHRPMTRLETEALASVAAGESFGELCERLAEACGEDAAASAVRLLDGWVEGGLLANVIVPAPCNGSGARHIESRNRRSLP